MSTAKTEVCDCGVGGGELVLTNQLKITKRKQGDVNKSANIRKRLLPRK